MAALALVGFGWGMGAAPVHGQEFTQTWTLRPGWNAVFLEVAPTDARSVAVFAAIPVESVWTRAERLSSVDFVRDQNEARWNDPGWMVYRPEPYPEAFVTTLHTVQANRPYLIRIGGSQAVTWRVTGRPSLRHPAWVPDAYNLRGFPVDPARLPRFGEFLRSSAAHHRSGTGPMEEVYRLGADGQWRLAGANDTMGAGEAYWVYSRGASRFVAPLEIEVDRGDGLDYDALIEELPVRLRNREASARTVVAAMQGMQGADVLVSWELDTADGSVAWRPFGARRTIEIAPGARASLRLAPRRSAFAGNAYGDVLVASDGVGTRHLIPVSARRRTTEAGGPTHPHVGLWIGSLRVSAVSEAHGADPTLPTPVPSPFAMRVLFHVGTNGQARLLKEAIQMWEDGTYRTVEGGVRVTDEPGRFVWLTRPELVPSFRGVALRDGVLTGRRLSTVGIDFDGGAENSLSLAGAFEVGGTVSGTIVLPPNFPTHPFRHRFHPDHDNLDERFAAFRPEAREVRRRLEFEFTPGDPGGAAIRDYGHDTLGGIFRETLSGLHHRDVRLLGDFRLQRIADTPVLNPTPRQR
ncbi:MAG: hypothetical protein KF833_13775 [Verrucomicrobiae bacterium]|nr:hypothetical protein [Verrucomicrobiae bacterium]